MFSRIVSTGQVQKLLPAHGYRNHDFRNHDFLMVSETKLDNSFPVGQFFIDGYGPPIRLDRDIHGGGLMLFVREDIPYKLISVENKPMEGFDVEINLRKTKWLLCCS